jgi:sec-independent protein translocase protein TatC
MPGSPGNSDQGLENHREEGLVKPFLDHLEDLRWMLIKCLVALGVAMGICLVFVREIIQALELPLTWSGLTKDPAKFLISFGVADSFSVAFKVAIFGGLLLSIPMILFFIGQFVLPALTKKEKGYLWPAFAAGAFMFLLGVVACYYLLLPQTLRVTYEFSTFLGFHAQWSIQSYLSFTVQFMIGLGLGFEVPVLLLLLVKLGVLNPLTLRKFRRHIIVLIFIAAAVITPTTDMLTLCLVALPMCLLYEACIWTARWMKPRQKIS